MTRDEKIILGSTAVITASAITMIVLTHKYETAANKVHSELNSINYTLNRCREDILVGNDDIAEGNKLLKSIVKKTAEDIVDAK